MLLWLIVGGLGVDALAIYDVVEVPTTSSKPSLDTPFVLVSNRIRNRVFTFVLFAYIYEMSCSVVYCVDAVLFGQRLWRSWIKDTRNIDVDVNVDVDVVCVYIYEINCYVMKWCDVLSLIVVLIDAGCWMLAVVVVVGLIDGTSWMKDGEKWWYCSWVK